MDKLDLAIKAVQAEIELKEQELAAARERLAILDEARALVLQHVDTSQNAALRVAAIRAQESAPAPSLQAAVRSCVEAASSVDSLEPVSASDVVRMLRDRAHPNSGAKSFHASVYVTLMRLAQKGELVVSQGTTGRRFAATRASLNLFRSELEAQKSE